MPRLLAASIGNIWILACHLSHGALGGCHIFCETKWPARFHSCGVEHEPVNRWSAQQKLIQAHRTARGRRSEDAATARTTRASMRRCAFSGPPRTITACSCSSFASSSFSGPTCLSSHARTAFDCLAFTSSTVHCGLPPSCCRFQHKLERCSTVMRYAGEQQQLQVAAPARCPLRFRRSPHC